MLLSDDCMMLKNSHMDRYGAHRFYPRKLCITTALEACRGSVCLMQDFRLSVRAQRKHQVFGSTYGVIMIMIKISRRSFTRIFVRDRKLLKTHLQTEKLSGMNPVKVEFLQSQIYPSIFLFQIDRKIGRKTVLRWKTYLNSYWGGVKIRMSFSHDFETFSFEFILDSILLNRIL